ncbi:GNAT family N-acetyltransferase [Pseudoalteromonas citrea]|nr:GNAT family N-acetyltransferase [Pseudoalteromonas citrea]
MSINLITEHSWCDILKIQEEAYLEIEPEDVDILKSKWLLSPNTCAVYKEGDTISAYLLAHPWPSEIPPKLHEKSPITAGLNLYLHDLALARESRGKGIAKKLVTNLVDIAKAQRFNKILLVAVQNSSGFWSKFGFKNLPDAVICPSYGHNAKLMALELKA